MKPISNQIKSLSVQEKIRFFHLLSRGICLHARGLASDSRKAPDLRLSQSDAVIEMLHRITEQSEHYYKRDEVQRPDADLLDDLQGIEAMAHLHGVLSSAAQYAFDKLADAPKDDAAA